MKRVEGERDGTEMQKEEANAECQNMSSRPHLNF